MGMSVLGKGNINLNLCHQLIGSADYCEELKGARGLLEFLPSSYQAPVKTKVPWGTWVAQLVKWLALAQVMISGSWDQPGVGLPTQWGVCFSLSLRPSLPFLCACTCMHALSFSNKIFKKEKEKQSIECVHY